MESYDDKGIIQFCLDTVDRRRTFRVMTVRFGAAATPVSDSALMADKNSSIMFFMEPNSLASQRLTCHCEPAPS